MNNEKMGQFISELRKSKHMTQKELAAKLNITDKAVSKWERGLSSPDLSLLIPLAGLLEVTTGELLNGERSQSDTKDVETTIGHALQYADRSSKSRLKALQNICAAAFTIALLTGLAVCVICDLAVSGGLTWSLYPVSSIIFAWLVLFPVIRYGRKGIVTTLIALSIFIIPFLWVLNALIKTSSLLLPIGIRMSVISIAYLWCIFALFQVLKERKLLAVSGTLALAVPVCILINWSLSRLIAEPMFDAWDMVEFLVLAVLTAVCFTADRIRRKRELQS